MSSQRFFILVLDGLRPDLVTPRLMPNLSAFRDEAAVLANSRAQYPSHTRVNKVSLATGTAPTKHGVHFNKIHLNALAEDRVFDIGSEADFHHIEANQPFLTAKTASRALGEAGKRMVIVHCGAEAAPRLLNVGGEEVGQQHLSMAGYQFSSLDLAARVEAALGEMPSASGVSHARSKFALDAVRQVIEPQLQPDVTLMWSDEPDKSLHVDGLLGPVARAALTHCDSLVADAVAHWRAHDDLNLVILSDHGHVETDGGIGLKSIFAESGLPVTTDPKQTGALLLPFGSGGLYLRDQSTDLLEDVVRFFQSQDWCGTLFTRGAKIEGTFAHDLVSIDHDRAPDLFFALKRIDGPDAGRPFAFCREAGDKTVSGSTHGGTHREELTTVHFAAGRAYRTNYVSDTFGGMIDVFPTVMHLLGVDRPDTMLGRPLLDMLVEGGMPIDHDARREDITVGRDGYAQTLQLRRVNGRTIIEHGWRH